MARRLETQEEVIDQLHKLKDQSVLVYVAVSKEAELGILGKLQRTTDDAAWRLSLIHI